jgi:hypothetical protein
VVGHVPKGEVIRRRGGRLDGRGFRSPDATGLITTLRAAGHLIKRIALPCSFSQPLG